MPKFAKRSKKAGLPPGTLVHIGKKRSEKIRIRLINYDESSFFDKETEAAEEYCAARASTGITWVNVDGIHQTELFQKIGDCFGLHPLVLEDIMNTDQRPKMEDFGDYVYLVMKMLSINGQGEIAAEQVSLILGKNFVLSFREQKSDMFEPIVERIKSGKGFIRKAGADYLAYALLDAVVDHYFVVLEKREEEIDALEEEVVINATPNTLQRIHKLRRELIFLRKAILPFRSVIGALERGESPFFEQTSRIYLRDIYDHTIHIIDTLETFRDLATGLLDIYLSSVSNRMNSVMRMLTVIATIFMPLTFLAGVYGMNFKHMPELEWTWGYPAVLLLMAAVGISMQVYFRRKKWL
ncbi:MAG: magnesium/cobalt transporter CorA [Gammaproteobacteria bacterium]|nr:magnesium/cobalt transporter CorA [Gammaproteobacteria bacterium]